jgi:predicted nucleic acid-binding Zn ribbon protein
MTLPPVPQPVYMCEACGQVAEVVPGIVDGHILPRSECCTYDLRRVGNAPPPIEELRRRNRAAAG